MPSAPSPLDSLPLEEVLEHVSVPSHLIDTTGVIRWLNRAARNMVGDLRLGSDEPHVVVARRPALPARADAREEARRVGTRRKLEEDQVVELDGFRVHADSVPGGPGRRLTQRAHSGGEPRHGVADQLRADDEEEHGHDRRTVPGHPAPDSLQQVVRPVAEHDREHEGRQHTETRSGRSRAGRRPDCRRRARIRRSPPRRRPSAARSWG
jgi:hypothetical protein